MTTILIAIGCFAAGIIVAAVLGYIAMMYAIAKAFGW